MFKKIGLSFSGGGFRASLFHLGLIQFLRQQKLLANVSHICSVSGGSITAAHLVLNWQRYNGTDEEYSAAVQELIDFTKSDLRGFVVRPWLFSFAALGFPRLISKHKWKRAKLCEAQYDQLLRNARLEDLSSSDGRPKLHLLSTSLTTGDLVSFHDQGIDIEGEDFLRQIPTPNARVALGVAASSAFPPLFAPVPVTADELGLDETEMISDEHFLTDGGVYDNLGIRKLVWLHNKNADVSFDLVIASRAERDNPVESGNPYPFVWQRATRSTDLMMQRISWFERDSISRLEREANCKVVVSDLTNKLEETEDFALPKETQSQVQAIRTDLDSFTSDEIHGLVRHGYAAAKSMWPVSISESSPPKFPTCVTSESKPLRLGKSHRTKLNLFSPKDWTSWASLTLLLLFVAIPLTFVILQSWQRADAQERAQEMSDELHDLKRKREAQKSRQVLVDDVFNLVDGLAVLLESDSKQQFHIARRKWIDFEQDLLNPYNETKSFFQPVLTDERQVALRAKLKEIEGKLANNPERNSTDNAEGNLDSDTDVEATNTGQGKLANEPEGKLANSASNQDIPLLLKGEQFKGKVLGLAFRLRNKLIAEDDPKDKHFQPILQELREALFKEVLKETTEIIKWAKDEDPIVVGGARPSDVKVSRARFRVLYWGVLGLVEGDRVEDSMIKFGKCLDAWEGKFEPKIDAPNVTQEIENMETAQKELKLAIDFESDKPIGRRTLNTISQ